MHLPLTRLDRYTTFFSPQWRSISSQLSPLFVKSILPTPRHNGPISIYTQVRPTTALKHVHTPTRARAHAHAHNTHVVRRANFSSIARIPSANPLPSPRFYCVFWHRGFVWPTPSNENRSYPSEFFLLPAKILDTRTRSRFLLPAGLQSYLIGPNIELLEHITSWDWINSIFSSVEFLEAVKDWNGFVKILNLWIKGFKGRRCPCIQIIFLET